jgi:dipeptidyl-peptidase-3
MLRIFGYNDEVGRERITYVNWLNMARAGLMALEFYSPAKLKWGQAHMQGILLN